MKNVWISALWKTKTWDRSAAESSQSSHSVSKAKDNDCCSYHTEKLQSSYALECCDVHRLKNLVCWHCLNTVWFWLSPTNSGSIVTIKALDSPKPDLAAGSAISLAKVLWPSHQFPNMKMGPDTPSTAHFRDCQSQHLLWELPLCIWILGCLINLSTQTLQIAGPEIKSLSNACSVPRIWYTLALQKIVCFWIDIVSCLVHLCDEYCTACIQSSLKAATAVLNSISFSYAKFTALP